MFRLIADRCDKRQVDGSDHLGRKRFLCLLRRVPDSLERHRIFRQIDLFLLFVSVHDVIRQTLVEIIPAQVVVSRRRQNFDQVVADLDQGNVKRSAAQVIHHDFLRLTMIQSVSKRRGGRLIDNTHHLQPGDPARVLRGLALGIVEIRRNSDDRLADTLSKITLRIFFQFHQNKSGNFLRGILLSVDPYPIIGSHLTFDG